MSILAANDCDSGLLTQPHRAHTNDQGSSLRDTIGAHITRRGFIVGALTGTAVLAGCSSASTDDASGSGSETSRALTTQTDTTAKTNPSDTSAITLDSAAWSYDSDNNVFYQIGVQYAVTPAAVAYESMGIYVPGAYFDGVANDDGSYTCTPCAQGAQGNYTGATAPFLIPVNTAGYSAQAAPSSYSYESISEYLEEGCIYVYAGCRGRDNGENDDKTSFAGGAPWGVTDLKAAIRCLRYNAASLPGDTNLVFTFGHSGGGAQSALVGATGNAAGYIPYLESIGAAMTSDDGTAISDATYGAMCWCPITSLDIADEAYEWMLGQYASTGTRSDETFTKALSEDMAMEFVSYVNTMGFVDADGNTLQLSDGGDGIYMAGTYYEYLLNVIEDSLNDFLANTEFPYTPSSAEQADGGFGGGDSGAVSSGVQSSGEVSSGEAPSVSFGEGSPDQGSSFGSSESSTGSSLTYDTAEDYIAALNSDEEWISYDLETNTAQVSSVAAFVRQCKSATKDVGAFDAFDRSSGENSLFGTAETDSLHFDKIMTNLLVGNLDEYEAFSDWNDSYPSDYAGDLEKTDEIGNDSAARQELYNPLYYLSDCMDGYGLSDPAPFWRIRTGIEQGDTSLTTEVDLALALGTYDGISDVDFATVWGQGHTTAEVTGSSTTNFLAWVQHCCEA